MKILFIVSLFIMSLFADATTQNKKDEYVLGTIHHGKKSKSAYFNRLGLPAVYVSYQCPKKGDCWPVIRNQHGKILRSYSTSDSLSQLSHGRYNGVAYLYYSHTHGPSKRRVTDYYLIDQNLKKYPTPNGGIGITSIITKDAKLVALWHDGVYKDGELLLKSQPIVDGVISNNPEGDIAVAALLDFTNEIMVTNLSKWKSSNVMLAKYGDRNGILSVYPKDKDNLYIAVYKNVNIYNKGLMGTHVDFTNDKTETGWLFNSSLRNVGFDPNIYIQKDTLIVGATDSTNRDDVYIKVTPKDYKALGTIPEHILGFEDESKFDLLVGVGYTQMSWIASTDVKDIPTDSDIVYGEVKYDIGQTLYKSVYFEGRFDSTHLSVAYLQNEAKKVGGLTAKASKVLNFLLDFDGFIGDSTSLRLKAIKGNINGVATFIDKHQGSTLLSNNPTDTEFQSEIITYGAYLMMERGLYAGAEYTDYTTPSAVGFSGRSKTVDYYGMDPNFKIKSYSLVFGYDEISYAKRYESDLSRFYFQGFGGVGWADYTLSDAVQKNVETTTGKTVNYTGNFTFSAQADIGYIFQQRYKAARGLGYSFTAGYKAKWAGTSTGQVENKGDGNDVIIKQNELELEMDRYDIWHGPYVSANFIW